MSEEPKQALGQHPSALNGDSDDVPDESDVEMTDEQQSLRDSQDKNELPLAGLPILVKEVKEDFNMDELLKMNGDEDIEVQFFHNGRRLELNTSIYEICKEQTEEPPIKHFKDLMG